MSLTNEEIYIGTNELTLYEIVIDYSLIYFSIARSRFEYDDAIIIVAETFKSFFEEGRQNDSQRTLEEKLNQAFFQNYYSRDKKPYFDQADLDALFGIFRDNPILLDYFSSTEKTTIVSENNSVTIEADTFSDVALKEMADLSRHQQDKSILALFQLVLDFYYRQTVGNRRNLIQEISNELDGV